MIQLRALVFAVALLFCHAVGAVDLHDMAQMTVTGTPGTGTITLGAATSGFQSLAAAGVVNGETVTYYIKDGVSNWEVGHGVYTSSGTTLTRVPLFSSNSNLAINASSGSIVSISMLVEDIYPTGFNAINAATQPGAEPCVQVANAAIAAFNASPQIHKIDLRGITSFSGCASNMWAPWANSSPTIPKGTVFPVTVLWGPAALPAPTTAATWLNQVIPPWVTIQQSVPIEGVPFAPNVVPVAQAAIAPACYIALSGSDANTGTLASPFRTFPKAQATMQAGGSVCGTTNPKTTYVRAGVYPSSGVCSVTTTTSVTCSVDVVASFGWAAGLTIADTSGFILASTTISSINNTGGTNHTVVMSAAGTNTNVSDTVWAGGSWCTGDLSAVHLFNGLDNGETISYYPPDGIGTAILDGGSSSGTTGVGFGFCIELTSTATVNGLQFRNFRDGGANIIGYSGTASQNNVIVNNIEHDSLGAASSGFLNQSIAPNNVYLNNYVYNIVGHGIAAITSGTATFNFSNMVIANNFIYNTNTTCTDCGAIYMQDQVVPNSGASTNTTVANNYIRDVQAPAAGAGFGVGIYDDDGTSNTLIYGNIVTGTRNSCFLIHGGMNNIFTGNICDMNLGASGPEQIVYYQQTTVNGGTGFNMTGNVFNHNIVTAALSGAGGGYVGNNSPPNPMTISNNMYFNYVGSSLTTTGSGGAGSDASPVYFAPQFTGLNFALPPTSPAYKSPISFIPTIGGWGYAGFVDPATGTPPSFPINSLFTSTVALLGTTCAASQNGQTYLVTDHAAAPVYLATMAGSGSTVMRVLCNGANWIND